MIVKVESPYYNVHDLKDKKVGWYGEASGGGTAFYVIGLKKGIDIRREFKLVESSPPALWPLLDRGELDAIIIFEPFVSKMLASKKYRSILGPFWQEWEKDTGLKLEMSGLAASREWYDRNQENVKKIIAVWRETASYIKANIDKVVTRYPDLTDLRDSAEVELGLRSIPPIFVTDWDSLDVSIKIMLQMLANDNVLIKHYPDSMLQRVDNN
jgi:ABC-type nitrate/sulfonate/bicarbonate transport system substrate-binding protein